MEIKMKKERFIKALLILGILFTACTNDVSTSNDPVNDKNKDEPEIVADVPPSSPYTELGLGINGTAGKEARYVTFGSFPQTQLPEDSDITVDEARFVKVGAYTYYKGSDGEWYAKFTVNGIEKYFLVEPIKWRILTDNYNDTSKKLLLAENILINCSFYDQDEASNRRGTKPAPNNYEHSRIRAYLNGYSYDKEGETSDIFESRGFLQTAFSEEEQKIIEQTEVKNDERSTNPDGEEYAKWWNNGKNQYAGDSTRDFVFLLSEQEATCSDYGFAIYDENDFGNKKPFGEGNRRIRSVTDFAEANSVVTVMNTDNAGYWWLRSPYMEGYERSEYSVWIVSADGAAYTPSDVSPSVRGVVPALCVK